MARAGRVLAQALFEGGRDGFWPPSVVRYTLGPLPTMRTKEFDGATAMVPSEYPFQLAPTVAVGRGDQESPASVERQTRADPV